MNKGGFYIKDYILGYNYFELINNLKNVINDSTLIISFVPRVVFDNFTSHLRFILNHDDESFSFILKNFNDYDNAIVTFDYSVTNKTGIFHNTNWNTQAFAKFYKLMKIIYKYESDNNSTTAA